MVVSENELEVVEDIHQVGQQFLEQVHDDVEDDAVRDNAVVVRHRHQRRQMNGVGLDPGNHLLVTTIRVPVEDRGDESPVVAQFVELCESRLHHLRTRAVSAEGDIWIVVVVAHHLVEGLDRGVDAHPCGGGIRADESVAVHL